MNSESRIFSTDNGAVILQSKTKNRIIDVLEEEEMSASEIRKELGKAKSTVSVHLSDLEDMGIIEDKKDPRDERKKIYYVSSQLLGKPNIPDDEKYENILENLRNSEGDMVEFLKAMFHLIRYGLDSFGLDIHPALKNIGRDAGRSIGKNFSAESKEELFQEISEFWEKTGLGTIDPDGSEEIIVKGCFDCSDMPSTGHSLCSLDEGLIEGIIEETLGESVKVKETECHGKGDEHCKFVLEWP